MLVTPEHGRDLRRDHEEPGGETQCLDPVTINHLQHNPYRVRLGRLDVQIWHLGYPALRNPAPHLQEHTQLIHLPPALDLSPQFLVLRRAQPPSQRQAELFLPHSGLAFCFQVSEHRLIAFEGQDFAERGARLERVRGLGGLEGLGLGEYGMSKGLWRGRIVYGGEEIWGSIV